MSATTSATTSTTTTTTAARSWTARSLSNPYERANRATLGAACAEVVALALLVVVPAAFNPAGALAFEPLKASLLRAGAALILAGWLVWRAGDRSTVDVARHPIVRAALAVLAVGALSTVLSVQPSLSFFGTFDRGMGWLTLAAGVVLLVVGADLWTDDRRRERVISALLLGSLAPCAYLFVQRIGRDPINWGALGAPGSTLGSPTLLGGYLVLVAPFGLYRVFARARTVHTGDTRAIVAYAGWLSVLLVIGAVLVQTTIRGPLLGLIAAALAFAALRERPGRWAVLATLGFVALIVLLAAAATGGAGIQSLGRFLRVAASGDSSVERLVVWRDALGLPLGEPLRALVGFGGEAQAIAFERAEATVRLTQNQQWDRAHNLVLDTWLTGGVVGVLALVALLGTVALTLRPAHRERPLLVAAILAAVIGHVVEASFAFETPTSSMVFWVVLGLAASLSPRPGRAELRFGAPLGLLALLVAPLLVTPAVGDALYGAGFSRAASQWVPWAEEPIRAAGLARARASDFEQADADLREAARRAPNLPTPHVRLLRLYLGRDRLDDAETECQAALASGPYRATVWDACGDVSARAGAVDEVKSRRARAEQLRT